MNEIFIIVLLILLNGVFSMSEIALISARKTKLAADAKNGSKGAAEALKLAENSDNFLSTIQIGITLIGILTGLYSGATIADNVADWLLNANISPKTAHIMAQIIVVAAVTYLSIVVGELVPKRIGLAAATPVAKLISRPMKVLSTVALPVVWILSKSTAVFVKLIGLKDQSNAVTEDEIKSLIQDCTDSGELRKIEQDIMERTLVLGDLRISAIMTPKVDVVALNLSMSADDVREVLTKELHANYPVYKTASQTEICGTVSLKSMVLALNGNNFALKDIVSEPHYFPETMRVYDALEHMKQTREHFIVVCDEFGDMAGILTPNDVLDGLIGTLPEQSVQSDIVYDESTETWIVSGQIPIYDFINHFELEQLYEPTSYSTLSGLILEELRHVPNKDEELTWNNIVFHVLSMNGARIGLVSVKIPK